MVLVWDPNPLIQAQAASKSMALPTRVLRCGFFFCILGVLVKRNGFGFRVLGLGYLADGGHGNSQNEVVAKLGRLKKRKSKIPEDCRSAPA